MVTPAPLSGRHRIVNIKWPVRLNCPLAVVRLEVVHPVVGSLDRARLRPVHALRPVVDHLTRDHHRPRNQHRRQGLGLRLHHSLRHCILRPGCRHCSRHPVRRDHHRGLRGHHVPRVRCHDQSAHWSDPDGLRHADPESALARTDGAGRGVRRPCRSTP